IWGDVLGLASVGVDQDFFMLGGTSLHAIEICTRIHRVFGVELPVRSFFETPTIEGQVRRLGKADESSEPIVLTMGRGRAEAAPLHCLLGIAIFQDMARDRSGQRTVYGLHVPVRYVPGRDPTPSVAEVARRYVAAVLQRQPKGPYHLVGLCFGGLVAYEAGRQLEALGHRVATVTVIDGHLPGAERVDWPRRLREHARTALREPGRTLQSLGAKWRALWRSRPAVDGSAQPMDVPLDDPQLAEASRVLEREAWGLRAHLLVFRATERLEPSWVKIREDFGWEGRAARLSLFSVAAGHLGILRPPHVTELSTPLASAMAESD